MLAGQKLQGVLTSNEVQAILKTKGWEAEYPLFTTVNRVVRGKLSPEWVLHYEVRGDSEVQSFVLCFFGWPLRVEHWSFIQTGGASKSSSATCNMSTYSWV